MSMLSDYEAYCGRREVLKNDKMGSRIWLDQESRYVHPFKIYGDIYYVGDSWVCAHLIDTGDGLLLLDAGNCGATAMLINAIWEAGFNPADIKWVILSHGHVDHIGAAVFMKKMFGSKIYLGAPDAKMFREHPEQSVIQESTSIADVLVEPDVEINDGDIITFGNLTIRFVLVPGHTEGVIACFFDAKEGDEVKHVGYYGGFGLNTLRKEFLLEIGDTELAMRQVYLDSLAKVRDEKVDIFLGNHCINNQTLERRQKQIENPAVNPFIDENQWRTYLDQKRDELLKLMADEKE